MNNRFLEKIASSFAKRKALAQFARKKVKNSPSLAHTRRGRRSLMEIYNSIIARRQLQVQ